MEAQVRSKLIDLLSPVALAMGSFADATVFTVDSDPTGDSLTDDAEHFRVMSAIRYTTTREGLFAGECVPTLEQSGDAFCDVAGHAFALSDLAGLRRAIKHPPAGRSLRFHTLDAARVALDIYGAAVHATITRFLNDTPSQLEAALVSGLEGRPVLETVADDVGCSLEAARALLDGDGASYVSLDGDNVRLTANGRRRAARLLHIQTQPTFV